MPVTEHVGGVFGRVVVVVVGGGDANLSEPDTVSAPSSLTPVPGAPFQSEAATAEAVLPAHAAGIAGIVHTALLTVPPDSVIDESHMPLMLPPVYCTLHSPSALSASVWKKFAAAQLPL